MKNFVELFPLDKLPAGTSARVNVGDIDVAVFNVDGTIYAIEDTCPHAGGSLGAGILQDNIVTCRNHGMKFDVKTGCFAGTTGFGVASYAVKVVNGKIFVALGEPTP